MRFADSQAADRISRKIEIEKLPRTFATQIGKCGALHDAELPLVKVSVPSRTFLKEVACSASPFCGALERGLRFLARRGRLDALIEYHGDVRSQRELNLCGSLWRKEMFRAVEMGAEAHAPIGHFSQLGKAKDLIAARIREDGVRPGHELVQAAKLADEFVPRAQIKMIGVCEDDVGAELFERFLAEALDGRLSAHGHEHRRFDHAMGRRQAPTPRSRGIGLCYFKRKVHLRLNTREQYGQECLSYFSVSGEDEGPADSADHIGRPDAKSDRVGLGPLQFFRVHSGKTNRQQDQRPKCENIE